MAKKDIIKVAYYYYKLDYNQQEIAEKMKFSRQKVNRLLKKALEENIVEIKINGYEDFDIHLEHLLEERFNLYNALVITNNLDENAIGVAASNYLNHLIRECIKKNGKCDIGISWGNALHNLTKNYVVSDKKYKNISVVQTVGGINTRNISIKPEEITNNLALLLGGEAYNLFVPALIKNKELIDMLYQEVYYRDIKSKYENLDIAMVGIGELEDTSTIAKYGYIDEEDIIKLREKGAVGDVSLRVYDESGNIVDSEYDKTVMGITIEDLLNTPIRIGIAYGLEKVKAIRGAIKGKLINVLITDDKTAKEVLELK